MSRSDKIYARIDELEHEFLERLRSELRDEVDGWWSPFLNGPTEDRRQQKAKDSTSSNRLQSIAAEIESLRRKMDEPLPGPALSIIRRFHNDWDELGVKQSIGDWNRLVIRALDEIAAQTSSRR